MIDIFHKVVVPSVTAKEIEGAMVGKSARIEVTFNMLGREHGESESITAKAFITRVGELFFTIEGSPSPMFLSEESAEGWLTYLEVTGQKNAQDRPYTMSDMPIITSWRLVQDEPIKVKHKFPDEDLIKELRSKYVGRGIASMSQDEVITMINHMHELIQDLKREAGKI